MRVSNGYTRGGCYVDLVNNQRLLPSVLIYYPTSGIQCLPACQAAGYRWCGLENVDECWGGAALTGALTVSTGCTNPCPDGTEYCDGVSALELYMKTLATTVAVTTTSVVKSSSLKSAVQPALRFSLHRLHLPSEECFCQVSKVDSNLTNAI